MAWAIMNPPMKRKMMGLAYGAAVSPIPVTPRTGKRTSGRSAVAGIGTASVTHQTAMSSPTAAVRHAAGAIPSGTGSRRKARNRTGPPRRPATRRRVSVLESSWGMDAGS